MTCKTYDVTRPDVFAFTPPPQIEEDVDAMMDEDDQDDSYVY